MTAAIFPLDTSQPWVFNGVTYRYDSVEDRWYVVSSNATDEVIQDISDLESTVTRGLEDQQTLISAATGKNNEQDSSIAALEQRVDALGAVVGVIEFKGLYKYVIERTQEACDAAYGQCILASNSANDPISAAQECARLYTECSDNVGNTYNNGTFSSKGTTNIMEDVEEFVFAGVDLNNQVFDWINVVEPEDYIELIEKNNGDTSLYQCIEEPKIFSTERSVRVKYLKETGGGDGNFNLQEEYDIRIIKASQGINIIEADKRYVAKPYSVIFSHTTPTTGQAPDGVLVGGELWFDTANLEMFVWNNIEWVTVTKPASQDAVVQNLVSDVDELQNQSIVNKQYVDDKIAELEARIVALGG